MPQYPAVETDRIIEFLKEKGFFRPDDDPFLFHHSNPYPSSLNIDADVRITDLNHLVEDWTVQGAGQLAEELLMWLGVHPIA